MNTSAAQQRTTKGTKGWFDNPNVGQRSRFVTLPGETGGTRFVLEYIDQPFAGEQAVPPHIHTAVTETFEILRGRARYRLGSETKTAQAGDRVVMPPMVHPRAPLERQRRGAATCDRLPRRARPICAA